MKKIVLLMMLVMIAVIGTGCGAKAKDEVVGEKVTIKHELGETEVVKNPKKVVAFDFGTLDSLDALGIEIAGLPKDGIPTYLSKYEDKKYVNAGGLKEPDFEKINEIGPDVIFISGRQAPMYDEFSKIAPTVYLGIDYNNYLTSFENNAKTLGLIFEKEQEVEKQLAKVKESITALHDKAATTDKNALVILANDGKISAYGQKSRFGIIHEEFGVKPVDAGIESSTHGQSISFEYIVDKNPDYLFVVDRGAVVGGQSSAKAVVENALVKKTNAYKDGNIVYLDPDYWYISGGGLVSVAEMVKEVSDGMK